MIHCILDIFEELLNMNRIAPFGVHVHMDQIQSLTWWEGEIFRGWLMEVSEVMGVPR